MLLISAFICLKKKTVNEYTDMSVLAPVHSAARRLSLSPAQEEGWEQEEAKMPSCCPSHLCCWLRKEEMPCVARGYVQERVFTLSLSALVFIPLLVSFPGDALGTGTGVYSASQA